MRRWIRLVGLLVPLAVTPALAADPLPRGTPESVGMSAGRLARIGEALRGEVERNRLPGAVIAVAAMRSHSERRPDEVPVEEPAFQEAA